MNFHDGGTLTLGIFLLQFKKCSPVIMDFLDIPNTPCLTAQSCAPSPHRNLTLGDIVSACRDQSGQLLMYKMSENLHWWDSS